MDWPEFEILPRAAIALSLRTKAPGVRKEEKMLSPRDGSWCSFF
jgi:hypothetical protein